MAAIWKAASCGAAVSLMAACATAPQQPQGPDDRPTEQVVAETTGRKFSNNNARSGFDSAIAPIINRCRRDGGSLATNEVGVQFLRPTLTGVPLPPVHARLPDRLFCRVGGKDVWGAHVFIDAPKAGAIGTIVTYSGSVNTKFISADRIQAEAAEMVRLQADAQRAMTVRSQECAALRSAYVNRVRAEPAPGMKVDRGVIVDVRGQLALVQYNVYYRQTRQKDQEWVSIQSLGSPEDCPQ